MNTPEMRDKCAAELLAAESRLRAMSAFIGLDGFVDEILHVVDKRESATQFSRVLKISDFSTRLAAAAGKSANVELVSKFTKLGGNGPIMANALATFGLKVSYLGNLGYPNLHPVFEDFSRRADVCSIAEPGYTDALEFEDGKIMLGKHRALKDVNWENIGKRFGHEKFAQKLGASDLIGFVNWTMLTQMSDIWSTVLKEVCPNLPSGRRKLFFDLADPEKRTTEDIVEALRLIVAFQKYFDVTLGLNEKESRQVAEHLGTSADSRSASSLLDLCQEIHRRVPVDTVLVHPTTCALASGPDGAFLVEGPFTPQPKITTGAGDHFNSGFCLGKLAGLSTELSLLTGVSTSGFYVRSAQSPTITNLAELMRHWPK